MLISLIQSAFLLACLCTASPQSATRPLSGTSFQAQLNKQVGATCDVKTLKQRAFRKYGWSLSSTNNLPSSVFDRMVAADGKAANSKWGSVSALPGKLHAEYLSPVTIGGQKLDLDFDTGSADFWVFSSYLRSQQTKGHTSFFPNNSPTFRNLTGQTWSITYGDGSGATGIVGTDTINIGDIAVTQAVELATDVSSVFVEDVDSDGIVGLAFSSLNAGSSPCVFDCGQFTD